MAKVAERMTWGTSVSEIVHSYAKTGWVVDLAVLDALASVERLDDVKAVPISRTDGVSPVAGENR